MDKCIHSGTLWRTQSQEPATDLWACVAEVACRRRACIYTGRESGGTVEGRRGVDSIRMQSNDWVTGGDPVKPDDRVRNASRTRAHGYCASGPGCVWVT